MTITITRESLIEALSKAATVAANKTTIPVLSYAKISVSNGVGTITATDLEQQVTSRLNIESGEDIEFLAPVSQFLDITKRLPRGATVTITSTNTSVTITAGKYTTTLNALDVSDFPDYSTTDYTCSFTVPADILSRSMGLIQFAVSTEETRFYLCGIHIHTDGDKLKFVATDGHRLALSRIVKPAMTGEMPEGVILPRFAVNNVLRMCDGGSDVTVHLSENRAKFDFGTFSLETKLIDGVYPEYQRVIPKGNPNELSIPAKELNDAIQRVAAVSQEKSRPVKIDASGDHTSVSCQHNGDSAQDEIEYAITGDDVTVGFQARYLSDMLTNVSGDAMFYLLDGSGPALVRDSANDDVLFVIMPMRV